MAAQHRRDYRGFDVTPHATALPHGGYGATVTLTLNVGELAMQTSFDLPPDRSLTTRDEALDRAAQYGSGVVDGLLLSLDRESFAAQGRTA